MKGVAIFPRDERAHQGTRGEAVHSQDGARGKVQGKKEKVEGEKREKRVKGVGL